MFSTEQNVDKEAEQETLSLEQVLLELNLTRQRLCRMGILCNLRINHKNSKPFKLGALGLLFFETRQDQWISNSTGTQEHYPDIFITKANLEKLMVAIENWDDFTISMVYPKAPHIKGIISVYRQRKVTYQILCSDLIKYHYTIETKLERPTTKYTHSSNFGGDPARIWNEFCESVLLIENNDKSPTNIDLACDAEELNRISKYWHASVRSYFLYEMYKLGFRQNLDNIQQKEVGTSLLQGALKWRTLPCYFTQVSEISRQYVNTDLVLTDENKTIIDFAEPCDIGEFSIINKHSIKTTHEEMRRMYSMIKIKQGDVLFYKNNQTVSVAYCSEINDKNVYVSSNHIVLRANNQDEQNLFYSAWLGEYLFLFLNTKTGTQLLDHILQYSTENSDKSKDLNIEQINQLELPDLTQEQMLVLDNRIVDILNLCNKQEEMKMQIKQNFSLSILK